MRGGEGEDCQVDDEGGRQGDHSPVPGTNWPEDTHLSAAPPVAVGSMLPNKGMNGRMPWFECPD